MTLHAKRAKLVKARTPGLADKLLALLPDPADLLAAWAERQATAKSAARDDAAAFVDDMLDDDLVEGIESEIADSLTDGFGLGWGETGADGDPESGPESRLGTLLAEHPVIARTAVAVLVTGVTDVLVSRSQVGPDDVKAAASSTASSTLQVEITSAITVGTQDGCQAAGIANVRLVAAGAECEFCQGYDGRIMPFDDDSGMPPLHRGCECGIEPLKD